jgi:hypothetical protein
MAKRAFILETGRRIAPFGDPVGEVLVGHKPLRERQEGAFAELGFAVGRISDAGQIAAGDCPCVVCGDDLYCNVATLREFLRVSDQAAGSTQCAISKDTGFARIFGLFQDEGPANVLRFPLF